MVGDPRVCRENAARCAIGGGRKCGTLEGDAGGIVEELGEAATGLENVSDTSK